MTVDRTSDLTTGSVWQLLRRLAIPASTGLFFNVLFNVTDTFCAGLWSTDAQVALGFSFPLFFLILAISVGLLQGSSGIQARSKGAAKISEGRYYLGQTLILVVGGGFLLGAIGLSIATPMLRFMGATTSQVMLSFDYLMWIYLAAPLMIGTLVCSGLLSAYGNTKTFRNALVITALLNLLLDPMLMFGWFGLPKLGMNGVGVATLIAFAIQLGIMLPALLRLPLFDGWSWKYMLPRMIGLGHCFKQSLPTTLSMLGIGCGFFINTYFIGHIDTLSVGAYGIAVRIEQLILLPAHGINIALLSIAAQNFGAKYFDRTRLIYRNSLIASLVLSAVGAVIMISLGYQLLGQFNRDQEIIRYGYQYLLVASVIGPMYAYIHRDNSILQAMGKPQMIGIIGLLRHTLFPVIFCTMFVVILDLGIAGVWSSLLLSNLVACLVLRWHTRTVIQNLLPLKRFAG